MASGRAQPAAKASTSTTIGRRLLADLPPLPCFLIQHSAYDEMVGMAPRSSEPLKIPLNYRNAS